MASLRKSQISSLPAADSEQIAYFRGWLRAQARQSATHAASIQAANADYCLEANHAHQAKGQRIQTFAPFRPALSAWQTLTSGQARALGVSLLFLALALLAFPLRTLVISLALVTTLYFCDLLLNLFLAVRTVHAPTGAGIDAATIAALAEEPWPSYTILCPLYHEHEVVPQFARAMHALDYPADRLQILLLTEADDEGLRTALERLRLPSTCEIVTVPDGQPRTKPRACNYGLLRATGDYIVIYDAEDIPDPLQLKRAVLTFAREAEAHPDYETGCVQAKLNFYNTEQNLLTRWFTAEYSLWFDLTLPGLQQLGLPLPLGGTSNHFRADRLRETGAWDAFNVTEDCDLGLRLARYGLRTAMLDSTTFEEANSRLKNWLRQRSRWIKGYLQTYLVYMRQPRRFLQPARWQEFLSLQLVVGGKTFVLFINPIMWLLVAIYAIFHANAGVNLLYHMLFPAPVLYMGALCLIFGNFLYIYAHFLGCLKRGQFRLMTWVFTMPLYWALNSVAAFIALYQLIWKPHYWEKTQHGLHLLAGHQLGAAAAKITPIALPGPATQKIPRSPRFVTMQLQQPAIQATPDPTAIPRTKDDPWLRLTMVLAYVASLGALWYFLQAHQILLYGDAYAHLLIPRRVFDNATPGLAQLGGVWLPLPHLLMLPFVLNDYLFRTGLAGTIPSVISYLIAARYLFLSARYLTQDSRASCLGTLFFILNPNVLYLQSTALTEAVLIATLAAAAYYFMRWANEDDPRMLIWSALATFLSSLARYDGWFLFVAMLVFIVVIGKLKRTPWPQQQAHLLLFGTLGGLGIVLWFVWNQLIFGDALYFQSGKYASQTQQDLLLRSHLLYTYHDLWQSFRYYTIDAIENVGPLTFALGVVALGFFLWRRVTPLQIATLSYLTPYAFYVIALFLGQAALYAPGAVPANDPVHQIYNARYGVQVVAPAALFIATLAARTRAWHWQPMVRHVYPALAGLLLLQTMLTTRGGIISLQDGQFGIDCALPQPIVTYLAQHYNGGKILEDLYANKVDEVNLEANIDFHNMVYEGSNALWQQALAHPAQVASWIIINPANPRGDSVNDHINKAEFYVQFTLDLEESNGLSLYHRNGIALASRPVPRYLLHEHGACSDPTQLKSG